MKGPKFSIDMDTGVSNDDGPFRSYQLVAEGNNVDELLDSATIVEVDQDGGDRASYPLDDASYGAIKAANRIIMDVVEGRNEG